VWQQMKKIILQNLHAVDFFFGVIWLLAWWHNAEQTAKFDLDKLTAFYGVMRAYILGGRAINSIWNSPPGQLPK
jgi:hypothetical protein